jgi:hypothetical protein
MGRKKIERPARSSKLQRPALWIAVGILAASFLADAADTLRPGDAKPVLLLRHVPSVEVVPRQLRPDFDVRLSREPLTTQSLAHVRVLCLGQPPRDTASSRPPPASISAAEVEPLMNFIDTGGAVLFFTRPSAGEDAPPRPEDRFLQGFGLTVGPVRIGPKTQRLPETNPLLGGLRWSASSLHVLDTSETSPLAGAVSVANDLAQKPVLPGGKDFSGVIMIWGQHGRGRLAVMADEGALPSSTSTAPQADNAEILRRLFGWLESGR